MTIFGVEITGDHARLGIAILTGLFACLGFFAGRWTRHREHRRFRSEDLVGTTIVTELYGFSTRADGSTVLHLVSQGSSQPLDEAFTNDDLVRHVRRAAQKHPGLLQLPDPVAHRMMMDEGKDRLVGHDPAANMDFLAGRPTRRDEVLFGFGAWTEESNDRRIGLHDEIGRLVQMVVSPLYIDRLADPQFIAELQVQHAGYRPRIGRLHGFAKEWRRLESLPSSERHGYSDRIWKVVVRTSLGVLNS